ncbi:phage minor head protein [Anaerosolibacter sp.]|uniref:phage minor head protein n=1 Tax=Anaerosolibacter sp. TaxID=1872527 RepID=UPI0039F07BFF
MSKVPKFRFPAGQTWDYFTDVRDTLVKAHERVMDSFEKKITYNARIDGYRADADFNRINIILDTLRNETFEFFFTESVVNGIVERFLDSVKNHTAAQFGRQFKAVLGIDPIGRDSRLLGIIEAANKENISYIQSIPSNYHDKVETVILQGLRRGQSTNDIASELQKVYEVSRDRAKFIARDQAGSLTADLTKARHEASGLKTFIWSTAGDDSVRGTHRAYDGIVFTWDKGADGKGLLPGHDYGCRCVAEINDEELLSQ